MKRRISSLAAAAFLFAGFFCANAWPTHHDYTFLPLLMTLDVNAFKRQSYRPVMGEVCTVDTAVPEVSGLCLAPDGKSLLAASDENGVYHVSFSGETEPFYVESRGLDCEGVTSDPETGDVYYIVERRQELRRLRAPEYQESELLTVIPEGLRTNSALWIADSELRTINLCTMEGKVLVSYPVPFIDNGEGLYVDHENSCIWVGDDTTSKLYKIGFSGL